MNLNVAVRVIGLIAVLALITSAMREIAAFKSSYMFEAIAPGCKITGPNGTVLFEQTASSGHLSADILIPRGSLITGQCFSSK